MGPPHRGAVSQHQPTATSASRSLIASNMGPTHHTATTHMGPPHRGSSHPPAAPQMGQPHQMGPPAIQHGPVNGTHHVPAAPQMGQLHHGAAYYWGAPSQHPAVSSAPGPLTTSTKGPTLHTTTAQMGPLHHGSSASLTAGPINASNTGPAGTTHTPNGLAGTAHHPASQYHLYSQNSVQMINMYSANITNTCEKLSQGMENPDMYMMHLNQTLMYNGIPAIIVPQMVLESAKKIYI